MGIYTQPSNFKEQLGSSFNTFLNLIRFIRVNYVMDELWDGKELLKFQRSKKTLITLCIKGNTRAIMPYYSNFWIEKQKS